MPNLAMWENFCNSTIVEHTQNINRSFPAIPCGYPFPGPFCGDWGEGMACVNFINLAGLDCAALARATARKRRESARLPIARRRLPMRGNEARATPIPTIIIGAPRRHGRTI